MVKTEPGKQNRPLTQKQRDFALAYAGEANGNGTAAARIANYKGNNNTLGVTALQNLRKHKIKSFIEELRREAELVAKNHILSAREVLAAMSRLASGSLMDVLNADGEFDLQEARYRGTEYLLKKIKIRKTVVHQPRYSRRRAATNAGYLSPSEQQARHDFRLTPDGSMTCVGCTVTCTAQEASTKLADAEQCIASLPDGKTESVEYITHEYEIHDPLKALELLGKHHRVWGDREQLDPDEELARLLGLSKKEIAAGFDAEGEVIDDDDEMADMETAP